MLVLQHMHQQILRTPRLRVQLLQAGLLEYLADYLVLTTQSALRPLLTLAEVRLCVDLLLIPLRDAPPTLAGPSSELSELVAHVSVDLTFPSESDAELMAREATGILLAITNLALYILLAVIVEPANQAILMSSGTFNLVYFFRIVPLLIYSRGPTAVCARR